MKEKLFKGGYTLHKIKRESAFYKTRKRLLSRPIAINLDGYDQGPLWKVGWVKFLDGGFPKEEIFIYGFVARKIIRPTIALCTCGAYSFPHKINTGICRAGAAAWFCAECRLPCDVELIREEDLTPYLSTTFLVRSTCCGAEVLEHPDGGRTIDEHDVRLHMKGL
jgi:hypothetical protein